MQISDIRRQLIQRRRQILEQMQKTRTSWQILQEPEVELEETAAKEKMAGVLEQLDDREKRLSMVLRHSDSGAAKAFPA